MGLKEIRKRKGLTQRDLADMIHMDHATVNRAEKRAVSAKLATYIKLAKVLDVTLADLFSDDRTGIEADLLKAFRTLPPARRDEWLAVLRLATAPDPAAIAETSEADPPAAPAARP